MDHPLSAFEKIPQADPPPAPRLPITRDQLEHAGGKVISPGRWANAVLRVIQRDGEQWVVKDFRPRGFLVRNTVGRLLMRREIRALRRLAGLEGVPADAFRIDAHALAYRYIAGVPLTGAPEERKNPVFFAAFERLLAQVHARGIVHLDVRNGRNVLITGDGRPVLIDYQSHLGTSHLPQAMRGWMERFDMAGVYKHWERHHPQSLGESRAALLAGMNRWRRLWFLRGYFGLRPEERKPDDRGPR
jgi:RIO-like serine/threonine protein kinase